MMNTNAKGDRFERRVQSVLSALIEKSELQLILKNSDEMWIVPKDSITFNKKKYTYPFGDKVTIDVSVEPFNSQDISFLLLIECKNLGRPVDVGDINEFAHKVEVLGATKGVLISSNGFQVGALNMAKFSNIALARVDIENNIEWNLHRIGHRDLRTYEAFKQEMVHRVLYHTAILDGYKGYTSLVDYFCTILNLEPSLLQDGIPYLTIEDIKRKTIDFLDGRTFASVDNIYLNFYCIKNNLLVKDNVDCHGVLGRCDFLNNTIYIDPSLKDNPHRYRFVFAHEIGHCYLHRKLLMSIISTAEDVDLDRQNGCFDWEKRLERQANLFASYLLIPEIPMINKYFEAKRELGFRDADCLYLDDQAVNRSNCNAVFANLSLFFNVSMQVVKYRLIDANLVVCVNSDNNKLFNHESRI